MSASPKILHPFAPQRTAPNSDELAVNAARWAKVAKNELPGGLGFLFSFFPKDQPGKAVLVSNVNNEQLRSQLRAILDRLNEHRRIHLADV